MKTLLAAIIGVSLTTSLAVAGPAEQYFDAQLRVVRLLQGQIEPLVKLADESAAGLLADGNLYLAGEKGMVAELLGRAGGLCAAKALALDKPLPRLCRNDVILLSDYGTPGKLDAALAKLVPSGARVVVFASAENPRLRGPLAANVCGVPVAIPLDSCLLTSPSGAHLIPTAAPAIASAEWAYTAELLGACRRQHKQLAVYLSIFLDEGRRRYQRTKGLTFEPNLRPQSVPPGQYARAFLASAEQSLTTIRSSELEQVHKAAEWLREASAAHRKLVRNFMGHLPPNEAGNSGDVAFFTEIAKGFGDPAVQWIEKNLGPGDVYLFLGYQQNEDRMSAAANALGARTIFLTSIPPGVAQARNPRHLYINPHWPLSDGCLELSGYDVKACPISGIVGMSCYFAICGEVAGQR